MISATVVFALLFQAGQVSAAPRQQPSAPLKPEAGAAAAARILATIDQSRSTNTRGYRVVIYRDGGATVTFDAVASLTRPEGPLSETLPAGTVDVGQLRPLGEDRRCEYDSDRALCEVRIFWDHHCHLVRSQNQRRPPMPAPGPGSGRISVDRNGGRVEEGCAGDPRQIESQRPKDRAGSVVLAGYSVAAWCDGVCPRNLGVHIPAGVLDLRRLPEKFAWPAHG